MNSPDRHEIVSPLGVGPDPSPKLLDGTVGIPTLESGEIGSRRFEWQSGPMS